MNFFEKHGEHVSAGLPGGGAGRIIPKDESAWRARVMIIPTHEGAAVHDRGH